MSLMSNAAIAASLRKLADLVAQDSGVTATVETETIGHAVKTTVTLWSFAPDAVVQPPEPQWCDRLIPQAHGPDRLCRRMLKLDGTCPNEAQHRKAVKW